jgi:hypothetical protein
LRHRRHALRALNGYPARPESLLEYEDDLDTLSPFPAYTEPHGNFETLAGPTSHFSVSSDSESESESGSDSESLSASPIPDTNFSNLVDQQRSDPQIDESDPHSVDGSPLPRSLPESEETDIYSAGISDQGTQSDRIDEPLPLPRFPSAGEYTSSVYSVDTDGNPAPQEGTQNPSVLSLPLSLPRSAQEDRIHHHLNYSFTQEEDRTRAWVYRRSTTPDTNEDGQNDSVNHVTEGGAGFI